jgi:NADP-dependent 3-hydroxy acid dehydrogenase YdfG
MGKLEGKVAIVTGASSGMGWATAAAFAREGAKVVATARRAAKLNELVALITKERGTATAIAGDIAKRGEIEAVVQAALQRYGRVDIFANIAGINTKNHELTAVSRDDWDQTIAINLTGAFNATQAVLPAMRRQGDGLIIHVSSVSGKWGDTSGAAYAASKHGLTGLAYQTMFEERLNGIRVTVIYPGLCDTPILATRPVPESRERLEVMMKVEDIAEACVFVAGLPARTYVAELVMMPGRLQCVGQAVG